MVKKIVSIGGGENGRILENGEKTLYETEIIDREIIKLTNKKHPNFLFLAHSMAFSLKIQESYFQTMKKIYGDMFGCECKDLKSTELIDEQKVNSLIEWADIIYEGGGDTSNMLKIWENTGFDKKLYNAWNNGKVICGISAGAVCWFNSCNSDIVVNDKVEFEKVDCLNWINAYITPHCDEEGRYESTKLQLKDNSLVGILLSNCSAIEIIDDKYRIIGSDATAHGFKVGYCYKAYWDNNNYYERKLQVTDKYLSLKNLLEKDNIINEDLKD